jgi:hypothetical protein
MCFVTGHDFSRAASGPKSTRALAPAMLARAISLHIPRFSAACSVVP